MFSISRSRSFLLKAMLSVGTLLQPPCDMMNAAAQTKPASDELRSPDGKGYDDQSARPNRS